MTAMWDCVLYFLLTGALAFPLGRLLSRRRFDPDRWPYRSYSFEQNGTLYLRLRIDRWQAKVPDMSRIFPRFMPPKRMTGYSPALLQTMIQETCVAELVHRLLCLTGLHCTQLLPGAAGIVIWFLYVFLFNLPYILIQRYNRPRLLRLHARVSKKAASACT